MALNIKDSETERLVTELAAETGETKTRAVKVSVEERRARLARQRRPKSLLQYLEEEIWPRIPPEVLGKPISKQEREAILGYGPDGV